MRLSRSVWLLAALVPAVLVPAGRPAEADSAVAEDEKMLKEARVTPDGPGLLAFFRERTLTDAEKERLATLVRQLGDDNFGVRERASHSLVKAGRLALPLLTAARNDEDAEVARRAVDCLREIEQGRDLILTAAAARVLAARKPDGAAEVLLAYIPSAADEDVEEAAVAALAAVGLRDGKALPAVTAAMKDKEPARRAAAASVVGRGDAEQRKAAAALLQDADAKVRFHAAMGLVRGGD
jgi:HEAT repeat protein